MLLQDSGGSDLVATHCSWKSLRLVPLQPWNDRFEPLIRDTLPVRAYCLQGFWGPPHLALSVSHDCLSTRT